MNYQAYNLKNLDKIPQYSLLKENVIHQLNVVGRVFPFKVNTYILNELIDWNNIPNDPIFRMTFSQKEMLNEDDYNTISLAIRKNSSEELLQQIVKKIRNNLDLFSTGHHEPSLPLYDNHRLYGLQHKYNETLLYTPSQEQSCQAYCTFYVQWPLYAGDNAWKIAANDALQLVNYLKIHPEVTSVLFTGGDLLFMKSGILEQYINPLLKADLPNLFNIRIDTKMLGYWPYRFTTDSDSSELLALLERISTSEKHLVIMANFSHPVELSTNVVKEAIKALRNTGATIQIQSPILRNINDSPEIWKRMWNEQVKLGCIPYEMFIPQNTDMQNYFSIPLVNAWEIFRDAFKNVSGLCRTVRGPCMSCDFGKIQILGISETPNGKVISLRLVQGKNPEWVMKLFLAEYDEKAIWINELIPAFGQKQFSFEGIEHEEVELEDSYNYALSL